MSCRLFLKDVVDLGLPERSSFAVDQSLTSQFSHDAVNGKPFGPKDLDTTQDMLLCVVRNKQAILDPESVGRIAATGFPTSSFQFHGGLYALAD